MRSLVVPLAALLASGCMAMRPGPEAPAAGCNAAAGGAMVGQPWRDTDRASALRLTGARAVRVVRPGDMVTMDYRADRLNVHLGGDGKVVRLACG